VLKSQEAEILTISVDAFGLMVEQLHFTSDPTGLVYTTPLQVIHIVELLDDVVYRNAL